jgi:membrane protein DedA with SNARE-associated domain
MKITELLQHYGYAAVVVGTLLEGETILILAGFGAHQGYLSLPGVMLAAFVGSVAGDQLAFLTGRKLGATLKSRRPRLRAALERSGALLERRQTLVLLGFRFVYGMRNATPLAAGASGIPLRRFALFNVIGAALWSLVVSGAGYLFGHGFETFLTRARDFEEHAALLILTVGGAWLIGRALLARRAR